MYTLEALQTTSARLIGFRRSVSQSGLRSVASFSERIYRTDQNVQQPVCAADVRLFVVKK